MAFDPSLPQTNSPQSSAEMRAQFNGLKDLIDGVPTSPGIYDALMQMTAGNPDTVGPLTLTISNPPTQAQVQAILNKLNDLITALSRG